MPGGAVWRKGATVKANFFPSLRGRYWDRRNYRVSSAIGSSEMLAGSARCSRVAEEGGLMAYGPNYTDITRRGALVVEGLKGAKPADVSIALSGAVDAPGSYRRPSAANRSRPTHRGLCPFSPGAPCFLGPLFRAGWDFRGRRPKPRARREGRIPGGLDRSAGGKGGRRSSGPWLRLGLCPQLCPRESGLGPNPSHTSLPSKRKPLGKLATYRGAL